MPTVNNVAALNQQYYDQALRPLVEKMEYKLTEGLEVRQPNFEVWMDESVLLRMDPASQISTAVAGINGGLDMVNEARRAFNKPPVEGGDTVYMQQQNYSLAALSKRDQQPDPFGTAQPALPAAPPENDEEERRAEFFSKSIQFLSAELGIAA